MELSGEIPVKLLCKTMGIQKSSFYAWKNHLSRCRGGYRSRNTPSCDTRFFHVLHSWYFGSNNFFQMPRFTPFCPLIITTSPLSEKAAVANEQHFHPTSHISLNVRQTQASWAGQETMVWWRQGNVLSFYYEKLANQARKGADEVSFRVRAWRHGVSPFRDGAVACNVVMRQPLFGAKKPREAGNYTGFV